MHTDEVGAMAGWKPRARQSFGNKLFRVNVSKSGVGWSMGVRGATRTRRADGRVMGTVSLPGTGLGMQRTVKSAPTKQARSTKRAPKGTVPIHCFGCNASQYVGVEATSYRCSSCGESWGSFIA